MKHIDTIALEGSIDDMRNRIASEQGAMHKVQLGVARWRGALATPAQEDRTMEGTPSPASQVRWHAEAQCHFMCWLEQGGFALAQAEFDQESAPVTADCAENDELASKEGLAQLTQAASPALPAHCNDCPA
ncbi:hypothetical protein IGS61_11395 [Janthinobacterium sp. FW305-129]|uniref:hypothetical protein n=1 Tax=Janthinobacterium sp. FW305-129 TaxID=2775054 RepID=UPI001E5198C9|nr:hypothetical protein [Janthinobacterium sp. FW305-129]MCC7598096.1 hypothetical protein [Janthinobacterium sp. FW305-129]